MMILLRLFLIFLIWDTQAADPTLRKDSYEFIKKEARSENKFREMAKIFKEGGMIAVTNDGPKGPVRIAKSGSIGLALNNNVKIITVTGSATKYWHMKSWDRFMLPKPFGKIKIVISSKRN